MKLSTKPRHTAPRMKVRDLSGKLVTRIYYTNSNAPGRRGMRSHKGHSRQETLIAGQAKRAELGEQKAVLRKEISFIERILAKFVRRGAH